MEMVESKHDENLLEEARQIIADAYEDESFKIEQDPMLKVNPRTLRFVNKVRLLGCPRSALGGVAELCYAQEMESSFKQDHREFAGEYSRRPLLVLIIFFFGEAIIEYAE